MTSAKTVTSCDIKIGKLVKYYRIEKGISKNKLARNINITHQQLGKYEHALNRIPASRLIKISKILGVDIFSLIGETIPVNKHNQITMQIMQKLQKMSKDQLVSMNKFLAGFKE